MSETSAKLRAFLLSVLMVTSVVAGTVALTGSVAAAPQDPTSNVTADNTPTHTVDSADPARFGDTKTVADVSYNESAVAGNVSNVYVTFQGDQHWLDDGDAVDEVASVSIELYSGGSIIGSASGPYDTANQSYSVSTGNLSNISRVVITATIGSEVYAEQGDVLDATYQFEENATGATSSIYDTDGRTVVHSRGTGQITGEVNNYSSNSGLEGASVWAFAHKRVVRNQIRHDTGDFGSLSVSDTEDREWFVRVVNSETGEVVDNDDYIALATDETPVVAGSPSTPFTGLDGEKVEKIDQLNQSDRSVGSGFVAFDMNDDGNVIFSVIPLKPGEYRIEVSENQSDASKYATSTTDAFTAIDSKNWTLGAADAPQPNLVVNENMTSAAAQAREDYTGADLYQESTDAEGNYVLSDLFGDGSDGVYYWVAAENEAFGFDRDFQFAWGGYNYRGVEDDSTTNLDAPLLLQQEPTPTQFVNVTPIGFYARGEAVNESVRNTYNNTVQSDDSVEATISRDGSILELNVTTRILEGGSLQEGNVTLTLPDSDALQESTNLTGEWLPGETQSGTVLVVDNQNDTMEITTGDDGMATVYYQTDTSAETFVNDSTPGPVECADVTSDEGCVRGILTNDSSVWDNTSVDFVGVIQPDAASLSGIITNDVEQPVADAVVWNDRIDFIGNLALTAEPDKTNGEIPDSFTLTLIDTGTGTTLDSATVSADRLRVGGPGYDFADFPRISTDANETFTLWTTSRGLPTTGAYTLPNVPASNDTVNPTTYAMRGAFDLEDAGALEGRATSITTAANATGTGNVVLQGAEQSNLVIDSASASPSEVEAGGTTTVEATIRNAGGLTGEQDVVVRYDANGDGDFDDENDIFTTLDTVTLDPGTQTTVSGDVDIPSGLNGSVDLVVATDDDATAVTVEVTGDTCDLDSDVQAYDANGDCAISTDELQDAINAWAANDITTDTLQDVINAWAAS